MKIIIATTALSLLLTGTAHASGADRNRDGLPDRWERSHHLSLHVNQSRRDQDHDGLNNRGEYRAGMDPHKRDSDGDGIADGKENAGSVTSFANGVLAIALAKGGTLSAKVTDATRIECPRTAHAADDHGGGGGGYYGGGNSGGGGGGHNGGSDDGAGYYGRPAPADPAGDDHGNHDEPGDDHGTDASATPATPSTPAPATPSTPAPAASNDGCGTDKLTAGTKVHEAELKAADGVAIWKEIKL